LQHTQKDNIYFREFSIEKKFTLLSPGWIVHLCQHANNDRYTYWHIPGYLLVYMLLQMQLQFLLHSLRENHLLFSNKDYINYFDHKASQVSMHTIPRHKEKHIHNPAHQDLSCLTHYTSRASKHNTPVNVFRLHHWNCSKQHDQY
jgi:hypothetical protein